MPPTLLIVGLGDLAGLVLNLLAQADWPCRIVLAGRDGAEMQRRRNLAVLFAANMGLYPHIEVHELDLHDVARTAEAIESIAPDVIFNTATLQSWRIITQLPPEVFKALDEAQFGPWLPMHLVLVHKLMQAVREARSPAVVVNAAFPDAVGPTLAGVGLAPHVGIGNVANVLPALRGAIGLLRDRPLAAVEVSLFTQHYLSHRIPATGDSGGAPFHARVRVDGVDVTPEVDFEAAFSLVRTRFARTGGAFRQQITAASAMQVLAPLVTGMPGRAHAPAPGGLPGGYAVRIAEGQVTVDLPDDLTLERAIALNADCQRLDGIDRIDPDGTVHFTEREMAVMQRLLGYHCLRMPLAEAEARARELGARYQAFAAQAR